MSLLSLTDLTVRRGTRTALDGVSLTVGVGECVGLIGPNGAGKTTLMRAALGLLPATGTSTLAALPLAERARIAAWMPQTREIAWPVSVETAIALGRLPHLPRGARPGALDRAAIDAAIVRMELEDYRTRTATRLSGGEQARVLIARALAQDTPLFMADEPIAGLDPAHQIATMKVFADLAREGRSVIVSLHDLGLAARHCTRLVMLQAGRLVADGPPAEVLTRENVERVFGVTAYYETTPQGPVFQPMEVVR
ncbi:ABC transporter ATP-binding protein [Jhaorihella thermophila]|uniref:Iron complex transport system ATP-binding protein n=1 Tax=Jhaorihella thermophila TaxID=488547 RepID=A0A1H5UND0_9RHOB|nr:ABC transporter ATP-binding protein [Jhaorihella thermophila]SEF76524.1 iron complex transport system ATP-binding protein [Jhaorihella thermophila]